MMHSQYQYQHQHQPQQSYRPHGPAGATGHRTDDVLCDRVRRVSNTIQDLRRKLAYEKELLRREKMQTGSLLVIPTAYEQFTSYPSSASANTPYTLPDSNLAHLLEPACTYNDSIETLLGYDPMQPHSIPMESLELTSSEKELIEHERRLALLSRAQAYRQHLKAVENKCKKELGAVECSINNLKRVSTELHLELNEHRNAEGEKIIVHKEGDFYEFDDHARM